jgi:hypothetical protein
MALFYTVFQLKLIGTYFIKLFTKEKEEEV